MDESSKCFFHFLGAKHQAFTQPKKSAHVLHFPQCEPDKSVTSASTRATAATISTTVFAMGFYKLLIGLEKGRLHCSMNAHRLCMISVCLIHVQVSISG